MLKVTKEIAANHQFCLVHGIHTAICDALHCSKLNSTQAQVFSSKTVVQSCYKSENLDLDDDGDDDVESSESLELRLVLFSENDQDFTYSDENFNEFVEKVWKVLIYFKRSSTRNAVLQN